MTLFGVVDKMAGEQPCDPSTAANLLLFVPSLLESDALLRKVSRSTVLIDVNTDAWTENSGPGRLY